jgi:hypothetical protein
MRAQAKNKFEKDFYKLMANAVFGKFLEDVTKHMNAVICKSASKFKRQAGMPNFAGSFIIGEDLVIAYGKKDDVIIKKPYMVGFTILELSKDYMYRSYYDGFKKLLPNCRTLFSDTDSLFIAFKTRNRFSRLSRMKHMMDFSNYPDTHPLYNKNTQNLLGYFKDEMCSRDITEFVGIRSKCYAIRSREGEKKLCKGVRKLALKKRVSYDDYRNCIKTISSVSASMHMIRSRKHVLMINNVNKVAFTSFDSKRFLFECGIHSVPYGHYRIRKNLLSTCHFCRKGWEIDHVQTLRRMMD